MIFDVSGGKQHYFETFLLLTRNYAMLDNDVERRPVLILCHLNQSSCAKFFDCPTFGIKTLMFDNLINGRLFFLFYKLEHNK